jgi:hypothetical protein
VSAVQPRAILAVRRTHPFAGEPPAMPSEDADCLSPMLRPPHEAFPLMVRPVNRKVG